MKTSIAIFVSLLTAASLSGMAQATDAGKVCPKSILPVCALKGDGTRATFNNACEAGQAGASVLHDGKCQTFCPKVVRPVCATDPTTRKEKTYTNLCASEHANAKYVHDGRCD